MPRGKLTIPSCGGVGKVTSGPEVSMCANIRQSPQKRLPDCFRTDAASVSCYNHRMRTCSHHAHLPRPTPPLSRLVAPLLSLTMIVLLAAAGGPAGCASGPGNGASFTRGPTFPRGVVAADHAAASEAGAEVLQRGGNAVDAAVATSFALSVVRPYSCGIGGGGFMVIHLLQGAPGADGRRPVTVALDYREMAPAAITPDFYADRPGRHGTASTTGALAIGTPGTVAGLLHALESYGTMSRAEVLAPAIRLAEEGFIVDEHYVDSVQPLLRRFRDGQSGRDMQRRFSFVWTRFLREGTIAAGDRIQLPEQAAALRLIAEDGAAAFYQGPIAEAILRAVDRDGGILTREDLSSYIVHRREPLRFEYAERHFITMPPPSSGGLAMAQTLGILQIIDDEASGTRGGRPPSPLQSPQRAHLLVESFKHAFADRAEWLADPDYVDVPIDRLLSPEYLSARAATYRPSRTLSPETYGTREGVSLSMINADAGTSHLSVVDRWGNAVACTETINLTFGSLLAVEEFGFILNNEMDDFTTRPGEPNAFGLRQSERNLPAPGKRPLSSMTPTIVLDDRGRVEVVAGASGGPRIITATTLSILNALAGMDAPEAVAAPRLHHQWAPDVVHLERGLEHLEQELTGRGHQIRPATSLATVQIIVRRHTGRGWTAASDPRKGGVPAGE